jgi:hypothetical protein
LKAERVLLVVVKIVIYVFPRNSILDDNKENEKIYVLLK